MEMNNASNFNLLFQYVLEGKIKLNRNNKENLLKFLENGDKNSPGRVILDTPSFSELICQSLQRIDVANTSIKVFLTEIVTILFKNELYLTKTDEFQKLASEFCISNLNSNPPTDLHLVCIKLATEQVKLCAGIDLLKDNKIWTILLYPNFHLKPKQITDATYNFLAKLVWKLNEYNNEQVLTKALGYIVEPILSSGYINVIEIDTETDKDLAEKIFPYLSALLAVLTEAYNYEPENKVIFLLRYHFIVNHRFYKIIKTTRNLNLSKLLNSCLIQFASAALRHHLYNGRKNDFCNKMAAYHRNCVLFAIKKRDALCAIDFVVQSNLIWSKFEKSHATEFEFPLNFERNGQTVDFSLQIIIHLIVPIKMHASVLRRSNHMEWTDVIEQFVIKMGRTITDYIYSNCYLFGNILKESSASFRKQVVIQSLKEMLRLKGHLNKTQTGTLFQGLYYLLEVYSLCNKAQGCFVNDEAIEHDDVRVLSHLLGALKMLMEEHNITWYESLEIINITAILLNLLKQTFLTTKQIVQVLDLIDICVKQFLSPNMSLLVESHKESEVNTPSEIGKVIELYSQHEDWEVRDSALNLLNSCTEISFIKYIPLQKMILENNLIIIAAKAGLTDLEFYVQCTALKCLTAATKINSIWQGVLQDNPNIYVQLIYIVSNEDKGMVRKEAVNVLTAVYTNQKLAKHITDTLHQVMLTAAITDLHWEVQLAALNFWKSTIQNHLSYRGILDGEFPTVTFSKEKRKIIVLNEKEIHRQLTGIMDHLSNIGCLTVLAECMKDIHNIEVMEQAFSIAKELVELLDKYEFRMVIETQEVMSKVIEQNNNDPMDLSVLNEEEIDKVIDSILSVDQSELIINLHDKHNQTKSEEMDTDVANIPRRQLVSANEFVETFRNNNYLSVLNDKKKCGNLVTNLDELLDEILNNGE